MGAFALTDFPALNDRERVLCGGFGTGLWMSTGIVAKGAEFLSLVNCGPLASLMSLMATALAGRGLTLQASCRTTSTCMQVATSAARKTALSWSASVLFRGRTIFRTRDSKYNQDTEKDGQNGNAFQTAQPAFLGCSRLCSRLLRLGILFSRSLLSLFHLRHRTVQHNRCWKHWFA